MLARVSELYPTIPLNFHRRPEPEMRERAAAWYTTEERETYGHRMSDEWRAALAPLGTDADKAYLDVVPVIIAMFRVDYDVSADGRAVRITTCRRAAGSRWGC